MKPTFFKTLLIALGINVFFLALCLIFGDLHWGAIDDYFMSVILTGGHGGTYNPHMVFVNAIYGYLLLPLYHLFPKIGWYYIGQMFGIFASFTTITYILLRKMGYAWGAVLASLFVAMFASDHYLVCQFTQTASILSAAGMLAFAHAIACDFNATNRKNLMRTLLLALGVVLLLWGSLMRWQAFLMGMPFFCIAMLFLLPQCWKRKWHVIAGLAVMFIAAFGMQHYDKNLYATPEFANFVKFQGPRATLGDGSNYNQQAVYEDLEEIGMSGKDYHMVTEWTFYDTDVLSADSLKPIVDLVHKYRFKTELADIPRALLNSLSNSSNSPITIAWFLFALGLFVTHRNSEKYKALYPWASLAVTLLLMVKLLAMGRLVYRVESGFWLYATVLAIPIFGNIKPLKKNIAIAILAIIATANIFQYISSGITVRDPSSGAKRESMVLQDDTTNYAKVFEFMDAQQGKLFMASHRAYMLFSHHKMPPYLAEPFNSYKHIIPLGYWTPYHPDVVKTLEEFGITNPIKQVVDTNVIVISEGKLQDYLQRHYYDSVAVDTLMHSGEIEFFKYRLVARDKQTLEYAK